MDRTKKGVGMKRTLLAVGALVVTLVVLPSAKANPPFPYYPPQAPNACGPGFYCTNGYGMVYGPNYWVRPPFEPFQGFRPPVNPSGGRGCGCGGEQGPGGVPAFPMHPFARSPRDFFMQMD
jgi:hypothetical protein